MMQTFSNKQNNSLEEIADVLKNKATGVIFIPEKYTHDEVGAALGLYLSLLKLGKDVYLACSSKVDSKLPGAEKFQKSLSVKGESLQISFPYQEGSVDKIDWRIEDGKFNIIITPMSGFPKLDPSKVSFSYTGGTADYFVILDAPTLSSLGRLYGENKEIFQGVEIINIDRHFTNVRFGSLNYVDTAVSSISEVVLGILRHLGVEIDSDIATNLYAGITAATSNFTAYNTKPETLEAAAFLLRKGAKKSVLSQKPTSSVQSANLTPSPNVKPASVPSVKINKQVLQTAPQKPEVAKPQPSHETKEKPAEEKNAPQDWLKPKIFSSKTSL